MSISSLSAMSVSDACQAWLESRRFHIAPRTFVDYTNYIRTFKTFFKDLLITDLDGDNLRAYQHWRMQSAGPETVNKELCPLLATRKRIQRPISDYQRLKQSKDYESPGRALSPSEESIWATTCRAAADHKGWGTAALCALLSLRTGMGPGEILNLKLRDVTIDGPEPMVEIPRRGAKRVRRERPVDLVGEALWAAEKLVKLAESRGSVLPDHFLVPKRNRDNSYDPTKHANSFRESFEKLKDIAGLKFRFYDHRHSAISKALRNPKVSPQMAREQFGHVDNKMFQRYYHGNSENRRVMAAALDAQAAEKRPVQKERRGRGKYMESQG